MTKIQNTRELPWTPLHAYTVKDEAEAVKIAAGRKAWLFEQVEGVFYLYVDERIS